MTITYATKYWAPGALASHTFTTPRYSVEPFLPYGGIGVLHGPPGVGKSQLALTMCMAVARGASFLAPEYPATLGKALYVQLNMPMLEQQKRLLSAGATAADPVAFLSLDRGQLDSTQLAPNRDAGLNEAVRFAPDLVVIDTLRDAHALDEIDSATVTAVYGGWRRAFAAATLIFVHHDRKIGLTNGAVPERYWIEAARGSSTWLGNADSGLHLTDAKGALTLFWSKTRICAPIAPLAVKLDPTTLLVEMAEPNARQKLIAWMALNPAGTRKDALATLEAAGVGRTRAFNLVAEYMGDGKPTTPKRMRKAAAK